MPIINGKITLDTRGFTDIIDVTKEVENIVASHKIENGQVLVYVTGSTAAVTSMEYEPGLVKDFPEILEKLIPMDYDYKHDEKWHDGNGYAHIRASIIGNSFNVPIINGSLSLGTWQQIVLMDFDNKPRTRQIIVQIVY